MVKQVGLLPAGCQPWNSDVVAASGKRFLYCATLAVYVYELEPKFNEFRLASIMSEHKKTITSICFHPGRPDLFVSCGADGKVIIWDCAEQRVVDCLSNVKDMPMGVGWCFHNGEHVTFMGAHSPMYMWNPHKKSSGYVPLKETNSFNSDMCLFRWHPTNAAKLVIGHKNGTISIIILGGKSHKHVCPPNEDDVEEDDPVTALEWDPLSHDYLIVCNACNTIRMIDSGSLSSIMEFALPSVASKVGCLSWIRDAPGMFVTGDAKNGILRVWNVSRPSPLESIKLKKMGIHAIQTVRTNLPVSGSYGHSRRNSSASSINSSQYALPPAQIVCTFLDGGVGLYDLGQRKWKFIRNEGHIETIFDCTFHPENPDLLATASFDGTIKLWDVTSMKCVNSSPGNEGVVYSVSWSPSDLNCIVASTSKNGVFIWDLNKGRVVKRFTEHGAAAVYSVSWSKKDSKRIMSVGADHYCVVRLVSGEVLQKYKHPGPVFGCDWSPTNKDMLATGCEDKCVRVYYIVSTSDQPLKVFKGHTAKVFHVRWSPLKEGILCSGSDDNTVRIWDYTQGDCIMVLKGHEAPIRGLLWNKEIHYMLISGAWDYKIRIWDIRDGACIETILDHGADVYGLTSHYKRPFLLASCSRDSTVRLWSLNSLVQPIEMNIIAGKPLSEVIGSSGETVSPVQGPFMSGKHSKDIKQRVEASKDTRLATLKTFSELFANPCGSSNLWELVSVIKGLDDTLLSQNYKKGIMHVKHLLKFKSSEAEELQIVKLTKGGAVGSHTRDEQLREAANLQIKVGNVQKYCELMVELGEWEKAISIAPGVSLDYWKSLTKRYTTHLLQGDRPDVIPYSMAVGDIKTLVGYFTHHGLASEAMLAAQVGCEGLHPTFSGSSGSRGITNGTQSDSDTGEYSKLLHQSVNTLSDWYYYNGYPQLAACCHLAVDDCEKAVWRLVKGNELELAVSVGMFLGNTSAPTYAAIEYLSRRCEHLGKWELAVDLLKLLSDPDLLLSKCCARCAASADELEDLHKHAGLPSLDECKRRAETLKLQLDIFECCKYYLLSPVPEHAVELGLNFVKEKMSRSDWKVEDVYPMLQLLACIRSDKLQYAVEKQKYELLALCAYLGALMALRREYYSIVSYLLEHCRAIIVKQNLSLPISEEVVHRESIAWNTVYRDDWHRPDPQSVSASPELLRDFESLMEKAGESDDSVPLGPDCIVSSNLPSHSDVHVSCITRHRSLGLAYFLEDGKSAISPNEALMWAKVNPFSPLASGLRINPF